MDSTRFDDLLRSLAHGVSRRAALGAALGGLFASGSLALLGNEARARKHKKKKKKSCKKKKCGECQVCQKGKCLAKADGTTCSDGTCQGGACVGVNNCPPDQVCDLSDSCCPEGITCANDVCFCGSDQQVVCSCPAGDDFCQADDFTQCCASGDTCDSVGGCVTDTCSASNDICEFEWALCGANCGCVSSVGGTNVCGSFESFECPDSSQCATDGDCSGDDICVDVGCRCSGEFTGVCFSECPASRQGRAPARSGGERAAKHAAALKLPLHAIRR